MGMEREEMIVCISTGGELDFSRQGLTRRNIRSEADIIVLQVVLDKPKLLPTILLKLKNGEFTRNRTSG